MMDRVHTHVRNHVKAHSQGWLMLLALLAFTIGFSILQAARAASTEWQVEVMVGGGLSNDQLSQGTTINLGEAGLIGGGGLGVDWNDAHGMFFVGIHGRASATNFSGALGTASFTSSWLYEGDVRLGMHVTPKTALYVAAGYAVEDLALTGAPSFKNQQGWELGAGIQHKLGEKWLAVGEFTFIDFAGNNLAGVGPKVQQNAELFRVGLAYPFYSDSTRYTPLK